jgi:hypothetical protein
MAGPSHSSVFDGNGWPVAPQLTRIICLLCGLPAGGALSIAEIVSEVSPEASPDQIQQWLWDLRAAGVVEATATALPTGAQRITKVALKRGSAWETVVAAVASGVGHGVFAEDGTVPDRVCNELLRMLFGERRLGPWQEFDDRATSPPAGAVHRWLDCLCEAGLCSRDLKLCYAADPTAVLAAHVQGKIAGR